MDTPFISHDIHFIYRLCTKERVLALTDEQVDQLREASKEGDAFAQYGYGRWLYFTRREPDSLRQAEQLFYDSREDVADSMMAYATMLRYGETTVTHPAEIDMPAFHHMMEQALKRSYGVYTRLFYYKSRIYGLDMQANPQQVADELEQMLAEQPDSDTVWLVMLAYAYEELGRREEAITMYEKAIERGEVSAYADLALLYWQRGNTALYDEMMEEGISKGCALCMIHEADISDEDYQTLSPEMQTEIHNKLATNLMRGVALGEGACAYNLWNNYHDGALGFEKDIVKAWLYLKQGARLGNDTCLYYLYLYSTEESDVPAALRLSRDEALECLLHAARLNQEDPSYLQALRTVDDPAFLLRHKHEMETFWQPIFADMDDREDYDPDEYDEDDGRWDAYS